MLMALSGGCKSACAQILSWKPDRVGRRGCITNVASAARLVGVRRSGNSPDELEKPLCRPADLGAAAYCTSKAAVANLTKSVALHELSIVSHASPYVQDIRYKSYASSRSTAGRLTSTFIKTAMTRNIFEDKLSKAFMDAATHLYQMKECPLMLLTRQLSWLVTVWRV